MKTLKIVKKTRIENQKVFDIQTKSQNYILSNGVVSHNSIGGYFPSNTVGGGSGSLYASSCIIELGKAQDKEGTDIVGAIIRCKALKNRFAKEKKFVKINIKFDRGMDPYSGLLDLAEQYTGELKEPREDFLTKSSTGRFLWTDPDNGKEYKLTRNKANTERVLKTILEDEKFVRWLEQEFKYASGVEDILEDENDEQEEIVENALGNIGEED